MDYVDQSHWDDGYASIEFAVASDRVTDWLAKHVGRPEPAGQMTAFEFGCFPGRYLSFVGGIGYQLNGSDLTPRTEEMADWLRQRGLKVGAIQRSDAMRAAVDQQHDLVYSVGFIEHFQNYTAVIHAHDAMVKRGGILAISCPNFRGGLQHWLHSRFDARNLRLHNVGSMDPDDWSRTVSGLGYRVLYSGCFGGFDFWTDNRLERPALAKRLVAAAFKVAGKFGGWLPDDPRWSPYVGLVAQKI
jgi:hypothetical protein